MVYRLSFFWPVSWTSESCNGMHRSVRHSIFSSSPQLDLQSRLSYPPSLSLRFISSHSRRLSLHSLWAFQWRSCLCLLDIKSWSGVDFGEEPEASCLLENVTLFLCCVYRYWQRVEDGFYQQNGLTKTRTKQWARTETHLWFDSWHSTDSFSTADA